MTETDLRTELVNALNAEASASDVHEYTPLDLIVYRSRADQDVMQALELLLQRSIVEVIGESNNPRALVNLFVALKIKNTAIADSLEDAVTARYFADPEKRLAAVTLLWSCGRALPPSYILTDAALRKLAPVQWLDLSLPLMTDNSAKQDAILSLIDMKALQVPELEPRLHAIWTAGGQNPVRFLELIAGKMSGEARQQFVNLTADAFGVTLKIPYADREVSGKHKNPRVKISPKLKRRSGPVRTTDAMQLAAHNQRVRQSSIVTPFREFACREQAAA